MSELNLDALEAEVHKVPTPEWAALSKSTALALIAEVRAARERLEFSQQTTTNVMAALTDSGTETFAAEEQIAALEARLAAVEALADTWECDAELPKSAMAHLRAALTADQREDA